MSEEEIVEQIKEAHAVEPAAEGELVEVVSSQPAVEDAVVEEPVVEAVEVEVQKVKNARPKGASDVVQIFSQASESGDIPNLTDQVRLSSMVYENTSRNSLSVGQVQVRLGVLGFSDSSIDPLGWYSEGTRKAVRDFQLVNGLPSTGEADIKTLEALFLGTTIEIVE